LNIMTLDGIMEYWNIEHTLALVDCQDISGHQTTDHLIYLDKLNSLSYESLKQT
jgi:hypothetical protein